MLVKNVLLFFVGEVAQIDFWLLLFFVIFIIIEIDCHDRAIFQNEKEVFILVIFAVSTLPILRSRLESETIWMHCCNATRIANNEHSVL